MTAGDTGPVPGDGLAHRRGRTLAIAAAAAWVAAAVVSVTMFVVHREPDGPSTAGSPAVAARRSHRAHPSPSPASVPAVTITDVGDLNFGMNGDYVPGGPARQLARVARFLPSDLTVANLETALGSSGTTKCGPGSTNCYAFQAPAAEARGVAQAGFSALNVANNHTDDAGPAGITETDEALNAAHLAWTGRPGQVTYLVRNGVRIALLGFAPYDYDSNLLDIPAAAAAVRQARAHAQLVIVFMHAGAEGPAAQHVRPGMETYDGELRGDPIAFSHAVVNAGADLVLGSGPHVLRAMQWYHGKLIAYSLGNFAGYYTMGLAGVTADSAILHVTLNADGTFVRGSVTPIRLTGPGLPEPDPSRAAIGLIDSLSLADLGPAAVRIGPAGVIQPPAAGGPAVPPVSAPATEQPPLSTATWAASTPPRPAPSPSRSPSHSASPSPSRSASPSPSASPTGSATASPSTSAPVAAPDR